MLVSTCSRVDAAASAIVAIALTQTIGAAARLTNCPSQAAVNASARPRVRVSRQQRGQQQDREAATEQDAETDEAPEILQRGKIDEQQRKERRRRRHLREHHAGRGAAHAPNRLVRRRARSTLFEVAKIEQHHAVNAESEQQAGGSAGGRRQAALNQSVDAEREHGRQRERETAVQHHPGRAEDGEDDEHQQDQGAGGVDDAFTPDQLLGLERDAIGAGRLDHDRAGVWVFHCCVPAHRGFDGGQALEERLAEIGVERRSFRLDDDEPAAAIGAHVAFLRRIERHESLLSTHAIAQHHQQPERVLLHQRLDLRRRHRKQLAGVRDFAIELRRSKARERRGRAVGAKQVELAVGEVAPVFARLEELRVDRLDLGRPTQRLDVSIHELAVITDDAGCFEHDVEMIEAAEVLEKHLKVANRLRALRQQPEDVGVE